MIPNANQTIHVTVNKMLLWQFVPILYMGLGALGNETDSYNNLPETTHMRTLTSANIARNFMIFAGRNSSSSRPRGTQWATLSQGYVS